MISYSLYYIALYYIILYHIILYYIIYIVLYYIILHYIILCYTISYICITNILAQPHADVEATNCYDATQASSFGFFHRKSA